MALIKSEWFAYARLMRLDKPIGFFLLLWPTLWAIFLASNGHPPLKIGLIFVLGVLIMRSAGCVINDVADRNIDPLVLRTKTRPIAAGDIPVKNALFLAGFLLLSGFGLVLLCNPLTIYLSFIGAFLAASYPFLKRITHLPQLGLGIAFSWGVPMSVAALNQPLHFPVWWLFFTAMIWPLIYDTEYAMSDKPDDIKIGVKSSAILFGRYDCLVIGLLQIIFLAMLCVTGYLFHLIFPFYFSLIFVALFFLYQQWLIHSRERTNCFLAFLNNHWVGLVIFLGIYFGMTQ